MKRLLLSHKKVAFSALAVGLIMGVGGFAFAFFTSTGSGSGSASVGSSSSVSIAQIGNTPIYDSTISPLPASLPSVGVEAYYYDEIGNEVTLAPSTSPLNNVVVTMESWACQTGSWTVAYGDSGTCVTTPGSTFSVPITFNIYAASTGGQPGALLATDTQNFSIPFRPSSSAACSGGRYMASDGHCYNGEADNISFNFSSQNIVLPSDVVYGIAYNTDSNGYHPLAGSGSPTDSLNVALTTEPTNVTVGSDTNPGNIFMAQSATYTSSSEITCTTPLPAGKFQEYNVSSATDACGLGSTYNIPAVQFNVGGTDNDLYPGGTAQPISFSITNTSGGNVHIGQVAITVSSISQTPAGQALGTCDPAWFVVNGNPVVINAEIPSGTTDYWSVASLSMTDTQSSQDACQGATVNLAFNATS